MVGKGDREGYEGKGRFLREVARVDLAMLIEEIETFPIVRDLGL